MGSDAEETFFVGFYRVFVGFYSLKKKKTGFLLDFNKVFWRW